MPAEGHAAPARTTWLPAGSPPAADSAEELIVEMPFDIRPCRWDVTR
ncbi:MULTISPECIES: hypothetical protein [Micromonospora]|uniref:Uncharacterized protein n=1 Tax=Micromonospora antibiotica TaxID=2807623 RepID=A0ABS3VH15_9ACTN|nr:MULTISPECIES: hypothetical protein [Micromonospora]MBO4164898.1 hypothetical protein [Micromonospora antibiotica]MBW4704755.1 hypothetical protein [Micromonospora sp. RL09-050-HVF-A]